MFYLELSTPGGHVIKYYASAKEAGEALLAIVADERYFDGFCSAIVDFDNTAHTIDTPETMQATYDSTHSQDNGDYTLEAYIARDNP